jgi:hypothetical protein
VQLTRSEIDTLAIWHKDCELKCAEIREYELAAEHKNRNYIFLGLKNSGPYRELTD